MTTFIRESEDGRYALSGKDDLGYHTLFLIDRTGEFPPEPLGAVARADRFEIAIEAAEEELRELVAQARVEFGF